MIELRTIDLQNVDDILALSVHEEQKSFVAPNAVSLAEAYAAHSSGCTALPFGIYSDGTLVGFVMFGHGTIVDGSDPLVAEGNYVLWRFMIDRRYQRRGLGRAALRVCLDYLRGQPAGEGPYCWLSYEPENTAAKALYESFGFRENGEICGEEVVSVLKL